MLPKSRDHFGRSRTTPRSVRRPPAAADLRVSRFAAAREVALRFVAGRWPELAGVEPVVTARRPQAPSAELLARLNLGGDEVVLQADNGIEYSFTFARDGRPAADAPLVAVVTVDEHRRIVKTSESKS